MQIKLLFELNEPLTLPLGYQYTLESLIYHILGTGDKSYGDFLHSEGYSGLTSNLKLFTFGQIYGKNKIKQTHITFYESVSFEIRCFYEEFCEAFMNGLSNRKIWKLNHTEIELSGVEVTDYQITSNAIKIQMDSPLTVHMTYYEGDKRKTLYLNPLNHEIHRLLAQNIANKVAAAYNVKTENSLDFICNDLHKSDKVVTTFKNKIYITAWYGEFILKGHPQLLTLLYNTGIGDRNSQGFGMFDVK